MRTALLLVFFNSNAYICHGNKFVTIVTPTINICAHTGHIID